jgi:hypothetical protein
VGKKVFFTHPHQFPLFKVFMLKTKMNDILNNLSKNPPPKIKDYYRVLGDEGFYINSYCINTKNHIIVKDRVYQIVDFLKNAETHIIYFKFKEAYLKGYTVYIIGIEIASGDFIYCHHRLNGILDCNWMLNEIDLFEKEANEDTIRFSCKRKHLLNDTIHE